MMRQIGERHHAVENALLLEATPIGEEPQNKTKYDGNEKEEQGFFFKLTSSRTRVIGGSICARLIMSISTF